MLRAAAHLCNFQQWPPKCRHILRGILRCNIWKQGWHDKAIKQPLGCKSSSPIVCNTGAAFGLLPCVSDACTSVTVTAVPLSQLAFCVFCRVCPRLVRKTPTPRCTRPAHPRSSLCPAPLYCRARSTYCTKKTAAHVRLGSVHDNDCKVTHISRAAWRANPLGDKTVFLRTSVRGNQLWLKCPKHHNRLIWGNKSWWTLPCAFDRIRTATSKRFQYLLYEQGRLEGEEDFVFAVAVQLDGPRLLKTSSVNLEIDRVLSWQLTETDCDFLFARHSVVLRVKVHQLQVKTQNLCRSIRVVSQESRQVMVSVQSVSNPFGRVPPCRAKFSDRDG